MLDGWGRENRAEQERRKKEAEEKTRDETPLAETEGQTAEAILAAAERQTMRDLADPFSTTGPLPEKEVEAAISKQRRFLLNMDQCLQMGIVNRPEYQTPRERLQVSCL